MQIDVKDTSGKKKSTKDIDETLYANVNEGLCYEVVKMQLAGRRSGTASTKTRAEVSGGGAKPWKQKGTGRARAGTTRSPIWRHGGTCFGPKPRDYSYKMPTKAVTAALKSAVAYKIKEGKLQLVDAIELKEPKCSELLKVMGKLKVEKVLIVNDGENKNLSLASRNLKGVKYINASAINVYDILKYDVLLMTAPAFDQVENRYK